MEQGRLYFVKEEYYDNYGKFGLLYNKENVDGSEHNRPCCYLFKYSESNIFWMIPVSTKIDKYEKEFDHSIKKYGICDNISFGYVLGKRCAFLPQNMFPVTDKYILNMYVNPLTGEPVRIDRKLMKELNRKARKKIRFNMNGKKLGMSDIVGILDELEKEAG